MNKRKIENTLLEKFGDPIGSYAGDAPVGVRDVRSESLLCPGCGMPVSSCECPESGTCSSCEMMPINGVCPCESSLSEAAGPCEECGMYEIDGSCGCTHLEEKKKEGPSKKTAQKILKGTKTFADKMKKVSGWAEDPAAAAAWMTKKATGKWPSQK